MLKEFLDFVYSWAYLLIMLVVLVPLVYMMVSNPSSRTLGIICGVAQVPYLIIFFSKKWRQYAPKKSKKPKEPEWLTPIEQGNNTTSRKRKADR